MSRTWNILVANGPNLRHVGIRDPGTYGVQSMDRLPEIIADLLGIHAESVGLFFFQSNSEGALIDRFELAREQRVDGLVLNAGALTHTSLALADCLAWISIPCVEVHISNVLARENPLRQQSLIGRHCLGVMAGFGLRGYGLAVLALVEHLRSVSKDNQPSGA
ncbi:MAG: 3-dehydroquinate dehydratase [Deltaproteobacteria bacterium]|nr:3-dehydroquinate dehydratase [Deltaproteobacteria bacterium]